MVIHFSEASIPPRVRSSIHPFLQIILVLFLLCDIELNPFRPFALSSVFILLLCTTVSHRLRACTALG